MKYDYADKAKFNYEEYWDWIREMSKKNIVFCSEYKAPEDFETIWEKSIVKTVGSDNAHPSIEKLFKLK